MILADKIKDIIAEAGLSFKEKSRTIYTTCPMCSRDDKFSILKDNGACVCYRGSCDFGKRWFIDWMVMTMSITYSEAKAVLHDVELSQHIDESGNLKVLLDEPTEPTKQTELKPIKFPEFHMVPINSSEAEQGRLYLEGRGVPLEIALEYEIMYSPMFKRVIFPVKMGGKVYGYQGRHTQKVPDSDKVRNNEGFSRETLVMFLDRAEGKDYIIVTEGPVDAIKFHKAGSNVSTMGKIVTDKQQKLLFPPNIAKIYLALDEDAALETRDLHKKYGDREVYIIKVPESCKQRCALHGKKADFGECTFDECLQAFADAERLTGNEILIHLK